MPTAAPTAPASTALTIVERVERSPAVLQLNAKASALLDLLPGPAAVDRFQRVVIQALVKNPELLECTPDSVVSSVIEAAAMGLEPTGAVGGAHLVPFNVKVTINGRETWEKRAQMIPDYRGVIRMVTRPDRDGRPSDVLSIEARVVKEGDDFSYVEGSEAWVHHVPTLAPDRSSKATTHVYAIARLRAGGNPIPDVMDRAAVERIRQRGKKKAFSPWDSDWDEMAKKTVIKRAAKLLPVSSEVRSILAREDEPEEEPASVAPGAEARGSATSRLAQRLRGTPAPAQEPVEAPAGDEPPADDDVIEGEASEVPAGLTKAQLLAALKEAGISADYAGQVARQKYGLEEGQQLTDAQRAELLATLTAPSAL